MADDDTIEETKQTLVQRFRAWGGKYQSTSHIIDPTMASSSSNKTALTQYIKQKTHSHHPSSLH
jgi:hypothetical protein